jgi:hypothetical protein
MSDDSDVVRNLLAKRLRDHPEKEQPRLFEHAVIERLDKMIELLEWIYAETG